MTDKAVVTREELEQQLERVQDAQTAYWDALSELEGMTGFDLDSTVDYSGYTVDDLEDAGEGEEDDL